MAQSNFINLVYDAIDNADNLDDDLTSLSSIANTYGIKSELTTDKTLTSVIKDFGFFPNSTAVRGSYTTYNNSDIIGNYRNPATPNIVSSGTCNKLAAIHTVYLSSSNIVNTTLTFGINPFTRDRLFTDGTTFWIINQSDSRIMMVIDELNDIKVLGSIHDGYIVYKDTSNVWRADSLIGGYSDGTFTITVPQLFATWLASNPGLYDIIMYSTQPSV